MTKIDPYTGEILDHKGRRLNEAGQELPDPTPIAPPVGYIKQPPLHDLIRQMVRSERLRQEAAAMDAGSFDDEDDFDVDDETYDPATPYEEHYDPTHPVLEAALAAAVSREAAKPDADKSASKEEPKAPSPSPPPKAD